MVDHHGDFDRFASVLDEHGDWILGNQGAWFLDLVRHSYAAYACMAIRRQLKADDDSISLMKLMREVAEHADAITFDVYTRLHPVEKPDVWDWRRGTFAKLSSDGQVVSRSLVHQHMLEVRTLNAAIEKLGDRTIAHNDRRGAPVKVRFDELQGSIRRFDELAQTYLLFITGNQMADGTLGAKLLDDPLEVFRHPFLKPPSAP